MITGDFAGDGRTGIAVLGLPNQEHIFVAYAAANGTWSFVQLMPTADFMTWAAAPGVQVVTGAFDDTGRTGIALTGVPDWTTIPVALPNPDGTCTVANQPAGTTAIALTRVPGWATVPVAAPGGDGTWTVTNQPAGLFPEWAAFAGRYSHPDLTGNSGLRGKGR